MSSSSFCFLFDALPSLLKYLFCYLKDGFINELFLRPSVERHAQLRDLAAEGD
jgi:hypothetical protein